MITLVLGGARSGKSEVAERMATRATAPVTYVATMHVAGDDEDLARRVTAHQARRPAGWTTLEVDTDLPAVLRSIDGGIVLIDSLGPWVAAQPHDAVDLTALLDALTSLRADAVVVSEEVGMAVHPSTEAGRWFRDALGDVNRAVAEIADEVVLVVAGRVLALDRSGDL